MNSEKQPSTARTIPTPAPTGWPMAAAFGFTLIFAGLLTHVLVSILGVVTLIMGLVGWFRAVFPQPAQEMVPVKPEHIVVVTPSPEVSQLKVAEQGHRARLPLKVYPYLAGIRGGLAGGAAMALLAILYGVIARGSVWYTINLLAAAGSAQISAMSYEQLRTFSGAGLLIASIIHLSASILVGLLYGVLLPIFPRRPLLVGGIVAPLVWSGLLYSAQNIINPTLNARIDWLWFVLCQFAFGLVAGLVVVRHAQVYTLQYLPFAARIGIEAPGLEEDKGGEEHK
jgi:hypothetical protein